MFDCKFKEFNDSLEFLDDSLKDIKLISLETDPKICSWIFCLELPKIVSPKILFPYVEELKKHFLVKKIVKSVDVRINYLDQSNINEHVLDIYNAVLKAVCNKKSGCMVLQNFNVKFDGDITILIDSESQFVDEYVPLVIAEIKKFGLNVKIKLEIDDSLTPISEQLAENVKKNEEIAASQARLQMAANREVEVHSFSKKSDPSSVKINTIPRDNYEIDRYKATTGDVRFLIEGEVINSEVRELKNNYRILEMTIADKEDAILCKTFLRKDKDVDLAKKIEPGMQVQVVGDAAYDNFAKEVVINIQNYGILDSNKKLQREDKSKNKRVEFHTHTKMSNMDAVVKPADYINQAIKWGHKAIAFTDHNGLYAYPDIYETINKLPKDVDFKAIYGVELDFVDDESFRITTESDTDAVLKDSTYVVFDIETTGLSNVRDYIIEIGAVKLSGMEVIDKFQTFINPNIPLSPETTELTSITDSDLIDAPSIEEILPKFLEFIGDSILVAHNAMFDVGFIAEKSRSLGLDYKNNKVIDTLNLARYYYANDLKRFGLEAVAKLFKIKLEHHHRAEDDADKTAKIWIKMQADLAQKNIKNYYDINNSIDPAEKFKCLHPYHVNVLVKNEKGLHNLYRIISDALTTHFHSGARTLKKVYEKYKEGLLIGSGCYKGDVFEIALNRSDEELEKAISFYDYIEVQHPSCYRHLEKGLGPDGKMIIEGLIAKIIRLAKNQNKIVIATGDVHYLSKEDRIYREIYIRTKQVGGGLHPLKRYEELPDQHFLTTEEMLQAFSFLGQSLANEIVVTNTNALADSIDNIKVFPKELYSLQDDAFQDILGISSIKEEVNKIIGENMSSVYGDNPHYIVKERIEKELNSIINNNFAPIYYISHLLVKKSLSDGYLVGSRGSVGSSFVATMLKITEVNPLKPHYVCKKCHFTAFEIPENERYVRTVSNHELSIQDNFKGVESGFDLKPAKCPVCGEELYKDGHDIPFETFLGLEGNKIPDIDLNFSGEYQSKAHSYVRELLGEEFTFRAGTIQTVAGKNAFGYVKGFFEDNGLAARNAQINRLAKKIEGVKRSSGQHPGGIVVVPKNHTIFDITPIQYPADDVEASWYTTHFDYHSFESNLLKLDILGHDDPTMIKFLMDYVKEHPNDFPFDKAEDIPLDDPKVYQLFSGYESIGITPENFEKDMAIASSGVPEFGTPFTKQMLADTKPKNFTGLVKISGLSHGTDVWLKNSQELVTGRTQFGKIAFKDIIGCRDDIWGQLTSYGMDLKLAFDIMEFVRKGKPKAFPSKWLEYTKIMREHKVPEWYIWSAGLIQYMFPKAHAVAYVIMAMRIAWFKVYKPLLFYSAFFSKRVDQFDYEAMVNGTNAVRNQLILIKNKPKIEIKAKEEALIVTLTVALEMLKRGFEFLPVDINKSEATTFVMEEKGLRMPFVSIDGLGDTVAFDIVKNREERPFSSIKDIEKRTRINKPTLEKMRNCGILDDLDDESEEIEHGLFALD